MLFLGSILFTMLLFLSITIKPNGWFFYFILSTIMAIIFIGGFFYELKQPSCVIKLSDGLLWIYAKRKWNKIYPTDMIDIKHKKIQSGRVVLNSGTLKITTKYSSYTLSNVKDVEDVVFMLRQIKFEE